MAILSIALGVLGLACAFVAGLPAARNAAWPFPGRRNRGAG